MRLVKFSHGYRYGDRFTIMPVVRSAPGPNGGRNAIKYWLAYDSVTGRRSDHFTLAAARRWIAQLIDSKG